MVDRQVLLSVPSVEVVTHQSAADLIGQRKSDDLIAVMQAFSGAFDGRAMLIFPQKNGVELTRAVLGSDVSPDEISSMEEEALADGCSSASAPPSTSARWAGPIGPR